MTSQRNKGIELVLVIRLKRAPAKEYFNWELESKDPKHGIVVPSGLIKGLLEPCDASSNHKALD